VTAPGRSGKELGVTESPPRKSRHYDAVDELVRRTTTDVSAEFTDARFRAEPITESLRAARPVEPRLVGSAEGEIEQLLLTIPAYAVRAGPLASIYRDLLGRLSPRTELVVLTHEAVEEEVTSWFHGRDRDVGATIITAADHLHFSVWAEDGYVAATDGDATYLIEPFSFPRYADSLIADLVSNATDLRNSQAPLYFQGGNLLIGDDFFLIGADYPAKSMGYVSRTLLPGPGESAAELVRRLYAEYLDTGRDLHYVGSTVPVPQQQTRRFTLDGQEWTEVLYMSNDPGTSQPLFHIDMFMTLAGRGESGRYRVLVGDPRLAAEVLGSPVQPHAMVEVFDNIARTLRRDGFEVYRNPLPLVYLDDERSRQRLWYFATANNALVERPETGPPAVYLPTYGYGAWSSLTATDESNRELWEELGYRTVPLGDFHPFAENLGAVHCITKCLARSATRRPPDRADVERFLASLRQLELAAPEDRQRAWRRVNRALADAGSDVARQVITLARANDVE
jgi:hypothetical protein